MSDIRTLRRMALPDPFDEREVWCAKELTWAADRIESLERENAALQQQIDGLQQRVHLCAGYDALEKENAALREKSRILAGRIGCGCGGDYGLCDECSSALDAPPTTDKEG